jgi:GT2 family glycosyltransferase
MSDIAINPLISVIVRTKDRPKLLKKALRSIHAQTYRPIEVVLVNDGGCALDIGELETILSDVRLNYIRLEQNAGRARAGNIGIENASGEYIGFLDDDDEFYPDHLKVLAGKLSNSTLKIAYTEAEVVFVDISGEDEIAEKFKYVFYSQDFSREMLLIQNYIPFMCLLFKRSVFHSDTVRFDETFEIFEDWKILIKLSEKYWFEHIRKVTARYVQWCDKSQINRRALSENFSQVAYKRILEDNIEKITPAAIYIDCVNNATEKMKLVNDLIREESNYSLERMALEAKLTRIEAEKQQIEAEKEQLESEKRKIESELIKNPGTVPERAGFETKIEWTETEGHPETSGKYGIKSGMGKELGGMSERMAFETKVKWLEAEKQQVMYEKQQIEIEKQQIEAERDRLLGELMGFQKELSNSLSWRLIERYRKLKDRMAPVRSRRRVFYEMLLKGIKISQQEGTKGLLLRFKRKFHFHPGYLKWKSALRRFSPADFAAESKIRETYCSVRKPVRIVMPVYNGYECLKDCMDSIFRNTDLKTHALVIIDDKSTDQRVAAYLRRLGREKNGKRIEVLFNMNNQGFVKTINRGMKLSPEDVIILNSDTLVTRSWVEKLQRAAYSKPRVATATPLSNYMTINGIPKPFQYNEIPCEMNVDTFAAFIEDISLRYYPEIPAGVGFCMYIKHDVLEQLGYFDDTKFEKGYAEETDFCMRALKKGFLHVLDDSTYIYHVGGVSFESVRDPEVIREKNLMIERNLETLRALHPEYAGLVRKALDENLTPVHNYIMMRARLMEKKLESALCDRSKT